MWIVHIGTVLSAYFILSANSFMQHPVGYTYNEASGRAELTDFFAVLTNKVQLVTFPHVIFAAYMTGAAVIMGVAMYLMRREANAAATPRTSPRAMRPCTARPPGSVPSSASLPPSASSPPATCRARS